MRTNWEIGRRAVRRIRFVLPVVAIAWAMIVLGGQMTAVLWALGLVLTLPMLSYVATVSFLAYGNRSGYFKVDRGFLRLKAIGVEEGLSPYLKFSTALVPGRASRRALARQRLTPVQQRYLVWKMANELFVKTDLPASVVGRHSTHRLFLRLRYSLGSWGASSRLLDRIDDRLAARARDVDEAFLTALVAATHIVAEDHLSSLSDDDRVALLCSSTAVWALGIDELETRIEAWGSSTEQSPPGQPSLLQSTKALVAAAVAPPLALAG